jgi:hypothetical protein
MAATSASSDDLIMAAGSSAYEHVPSHIGLGQAATDDIIGSCNKNR